ncbi:MAG: hypothetical protein P1P84_06240 [Deferrisomatales bacterium]|nr:hypothetical protein [Deferrisomatales bacterium]
MDEFLRRHLAKMLAVILVSALACAIIVSVFYRYYFPGDIVLEHSIWGVFGDFFGGVLNPILSFLGLIALLLTIVLQSSELRITREEFKLAREAQEKSEAALREQADIMSRQLQQTKVAANAQYFFKAQEMLQTDEIRMARRTVFQLLDDNRDFLDWNEEQKLIGENVCMTFDVVGMMVRNGFIPPELILDSWNASIRKSWDATSELVMERRKLAGTNRFWDDFEWLHKEASKMPMS